jgi:hypothetical protein
MKSIPTIYNDIQFRSRLEARWAAFFDLMNWTYEYEPFDLDGWFPDFLITGENNSFKTLIEVKPIDSFDLNTAKKIAKAGEQKHDLLLLGSKLLVDTWGIYDSTLALGWFLDKETEWTDELEWNIAEFTSWTDNKKAKTIDEKYTFGFADCIGDFTCRITGQHSKGDHFLSFKKSESSKDYTPIVQELQKRWIKAKNIVQWRG